jgi:hypothetical protein
MQQLLGWLILFAMFSFVVFAFRKGRRVKRDPNKRHEDTRHAIMTDDGLPLP